MYHAGTCQSKEYQCTNGKCLSGILVCNLDDDCGDNSDEIQCGKSELFIERLGKFEMCCFSSATFSMRAGGHYSLVYFVGIASGNSGITNLQGSKFS